MLGVVVTGATGRMGGEILRAAAADPGLHIVAATAAPHEVKVGSFAGALVGLPELGAPVLADIGEALGHRPGVVIDYSAPAASVSHAQACAAAGVAMVIGTTGLSPEQRTQIQAASAKVAIVLAPNTSVGVNTLIALCAEAARRLGSAYDVEVFEAHHKHKKDAPSGTALRLATVLAQALGRDPAADVATAREGARREGEIGVAAIRGGDVVGEHTVFFLGEGERLEITHRATSRAQFARGALRAAHWVVGQPPGLYGMEHVLGL